MSWHYPFNVNMDVPYGFLLFKKKKKKLLYLLVWLYFFLSPPKKKDHFHRLAGHFAPARYVAMSKNITAIN